AGDAAQRHAVAADLERLARRDDTRPLRRRAPGQQRRDNSELQIFSPRARSSATTAARPSLSMSLMPRALIRVVIHRFPSSSQKRLSLRLTANRRLVCRFEWLTFEPTIGFFPVTWHSRDIVSSPRSSIP